MSPGEVEEVTHILLTTTLKEGEMWGNDVANISIAGLMVKERYLSSSLFFTSYYDGTHQEIE